MSKILARLSQYGACDVADALTKLRVPAGGFLSGLEMRSPGASTSVVGRAHTVLFRRNTVSPPVKRFTGHYVCQSLIDHCKPGTILFLSAPAGMPNAVYGGLMSCRAKALGSIGTIVDGRVRDLAEHRAQQYPLWSRGIGITAGGEVCYSSEIGVPVPLRSEDQPDVWVNPGDILVADENGVACIPQALEEEVAELIPRLAARDKRCMEELLEGSSAEEVFKRHRSS